MEMPELVEMLKARQGEKSVEEYAHELGLTTSFLYLIYNNKRGMSVPTIRKVAAYFNSRGDTQMIEALGAYAIGLDLAPSLH